MPEHVISDEPLAFSVLDRQRLAAFWDSSLGVEGHVGRVEMYLMQQLSQLVDAWFTAEMERELDTIAQGALKRTVYLDRVWREALQPAIARAQRTLPRLRVPGQEAVFDVQGGQVSLRTAQGVVTLPSELLPEDLNEQSIAALLAGTWRVGRVAQAEKKRGSSRSGSFSQKSRDNAVPSNGGKKFGQRSLRKKNYKV